MAIAEILKFDKTGSLSYGFYMNTRKSDRPDTDIEKLYREARLAQKRLNTLLKFLPDPVFAFSLDNTVEYVNPAFERVFGWTLEEIRGRNINFIPDHLVDQARQGMKRMYRDRTVHDFETQRYTKDGRLLDILINGSILYDEQDNPTGQALILRDMTVEKRMAKTNEVMYRISTALDSYEKLEDLIALVNREIKELIAVEGAFILLADPSGNDLYFFSAQYRNPESEKQFEKIRFPSDQGVSGHVFQTGRPMIIPDVSQCPFFLRRVDEETGMITKNMMSVPIRLKDRIIGVVSLVNKHLGDFDDTDIELLGMVTGSIALPIENTRIHEELKRSYQELKVLNRAKDNVINHLAHEMKTPVSVLEASLKLLSKKILAQGAISPQIEKMLSRSRRNLERILDIQYEVEDLLRKKDFKAYHILSRMVDACRDELNLLFDSEINDPALVSRVSRIIDGLFGPEKLEPVTLVLHHCLDTLMERIKPAFRHRKIAVRTQFDKDIRISMVPEILDTIVRGILRNAVEYTPDGGRIDITAGMDQNRPVLIIRDTGIGFTGERLHLIFENFFNPPGSMNYSTRQPFDFNAGGRGFDLLRIKLFSERHGFRIWIDSTRCRHIPTEADACPGDIAACPACRTADDCFSSGGTAVHIEFNSP